MFEGIRNGFRRQKKLSRKQREAQDKSTNFIKAYEEVCKEHGLQLDAKIEVTPDGVVPRIRIMEFKPKPDFETKDWDECKKENEETRRRLKEEAKGEDRGEEEENGDDKNV
jgi:hypothetical protein